MKLRQSCRKNRTIKAGDVVVPLRMACRRQMQRRNTQHRQMQHPHRKRLKRHVHTPQIKIYNNQNSPNEAASILQEIPHHQGWWIGCYSAHHTQTSDAAAQHAAQTNATSTPQAPETSRQHPSNQNIQYSKLTKTSNVNPAGNTAASRLVMWFLCCATQADVRCSGETRNTNKCNIHTTSTSNVTFKPIKSKYSTIKTHKNKLLQSCRKYRTIKAGDVVALLRITSRRQMQRRNTQHKQMQHPHRKRLKRHVHTLNTIFDNQNSPNEASSILQEIPHHPGWWCGFSAAHHKQPSDAASSFNNWMIMLQGKW
jgi:hypothetical protein